MIAVRSLRAIARWLVSATASLTFSEASSIVANRRNEYCQGNPPL